MRITEVTASNEKTLQTYEWKSPREVAGWLRKKGFQLKGSGRFGAVFSKPGYNRLVKISRREDVCWLRFAHWTLGMKSNPAVPYIDWVSTYKGKDGTEFFIAVIEKLAPFNRSAIMNTRDLPGLAYVLYLHYTDMNTAIDSDLEDVIIDRLIRDNVCDEKDFSKSKVDKTTLNKLRKFALTSKGGKTFINALNSSRSKTDGKCSFDMHDGNLMYRPSDGRLVVSDPLGDLSEISAFTA